MTKNPLPGKNEDLDLKTTLPSSRVWISNVNQAVEKSASNGLYYTTFTLNGEIREIQEKAINGLITGRLKDGNFVDIPVTVKRDQAIQVEPSVLNIGAIKLNEVPPVRVEVLGKTTGAVAKVVSDGLELPFERTLGESGLKLAIKVAWKDTVGLQMQRCQVWLEGESEAAATFVVYGEVAK